MYYSILQLHFSIYSSNQIFDSDNLLTACKQGFFGKSCNSPCPVGYFGKNCGGVCFPYCSVDKCDRVYGCQKTVSIEQIIQTTYSGIVG